MDRNNNNNNNNKNNNQNRKLSLANKLTESLKMRTSELNFMTKLMLIKNNSKKQDDRSVRIYHKTISEVVDITKRDCGDKNVYDYLCNKFDEQTFESFENDALKEIKNVFQLSDTEYAKLKLKYGE